MKPSGIIGFILACGILALSLSSCGLIVINYPKDSDGADSDTAFTETNETENAGYEKTEKDYSKEAAARLGALEGADYGGAVVKIASTVSFLTDKEDAPQIVSPAVADRNAAVEEKYGVSLYTADVDSAQLFAELSSSAKSGMYYADMITVPQKSLVSYIASGLLFNLRSLPKMNLGADYFNASSVEAAGAGYGTYAVAGEATYTPYSLPAVFFSTERLSALGLELPYGKAAAGTWTWEEFYNYLTEVDAEKYAPLCTGAAGDIAVDGAYFSVGGRFMSAGAMKYPTVSITEEEGTRLVGLIADAFLCEGSLTGENGGVGAFESSAVFMTDTLDTLDTLASTSMKWGIVPMPKADRTQSSYISLATSSSAFFAVPSVLNSDERTSLVLQAIFASSYGSVREAFIGYTQNSMLCDNGSANMLELITGDIRYDFTYTVSSMYEEAAAATSYAVRNAVFGTADLGASLRGAVPRCESAMAAAFPMR